MIDLPDRWPTTIREINDLSDKQKRAVYRLLLPDWVFSTFDIDTVDFGAPSNQQVRLRCPRGSNAVEMSVFHQPAAHDPVVYVHMCDTFMSQLIVLMAVVNDPSAPRFNVDVDRTGQPTQLGTQSRNLEEEGRAMEAGLAPGQVRRGLGVFRTAIPLFDQFVKKMGHELYFIEPLFYHNAITFERYGFAYSRGANMMRHIHREFQPGGALHAQLDGGTPFRHPDAWQTVSGRSWALHDGVWGKSLDGLQMYRQIGRNAAMCTFPDARWR